MMGPREVLAELDRLGITIWWQQASPGPGAHLEPGTRIEPLSQVPRELRAAIDAHTETLLQVMSRRPGQTPGSYYRPPGPGGAA
jgi:hypothetical protein